MCARSGQQVGRRRVRRTVCCQRAVAGKAGRLCDTVAVGGRRAIDDGRADQHTTTTRLVASERAQTQRGECALGAHIRISMVACSFGLHSCRAEYGLDVKNSRDVLKKRYQI